MPQSVLEENQRVLSRNLVFIALSMGRADERAVFLCDEKPYQSIGKADADNQ